MCYTVFRDFRYPNITIFLGSFHPGVLGGLSVSLGNRRESVGITECLLTVGSLSADGAEYRGRTTPLASGTLPALR